jgi:hypothetical protein
MKVKNYLFNFEQVCDEVLGKEETGLIVKLLLELWLYQPRFVVI